MPDYMYLLESRLSPEQRAVMERVQELSRTQDVNVNHIARTLAGLGIDVREVRIVPDIEAEIVAAVSALRVRYTYVFTTGGIGPTHDDITAEAIAKAFGVALEENAEAVAMLLARYASPSELNEARRRMARVPKGASLVKNSVSGALTCVTDARELRPHQ